MIQSIENDRALAVSASNPFETETRLYSKELKSDDIPVSVVVPDFHHVAFPNLGHQMLEYQLNQVNGIYADRAYLNRDYSLLKEKQQLKPEIIFISMSYEGSYIRALRMLDLMGCPLNKKDRKKGDPLIVIGGWSVSRNPLPLFEIADVIGIGDSDLIVAELSEKYKAHRNSRESFYDEITQIEGIIVTSRYQVTTENGYLNSWSATNAPEIIRPSRSKSLPHSWYLSSETDYNDIGYYDGKKFFSLEIVDACGSKCVFCASGFKNRNIDFKDPEAIIKLAEWGTSFGADVVKLFFPANSTLEGTKTIIRALIDRGLSPRVGSAKAEKIDREYIELVGKSGQEKIAFAPETGDFTLRKHLGKPGMTNEVLEEVIRTSIHAGIPNIDLYFILNLAKEAQDSSQKTVDLIMRFYELAQKEGLQGRLRMSAPNFFPKAWTPLQYAESGKIDIYLQKIAVLKNVVGPYVAVSSMAESVDLLSQNIMSRGGVEVGQLLIELYRKLKERELLTGEYQVDTFEDWRETMSTLGLSEDAYFSEKSTDKMLPWNYIHLNSSIGLQQVIKAWQVFQNKRAEFVIS